MEAEEKKRKRSRRKFTDEFKEGAVSLVLDQGKLPAEVARNLDLTPSSLGHWVEQARADRGKSKRGTLTTDEREELSLAIIGGVLQIFHGRSGLRRGLASLPDVVAR